MASLIFNQRPESPPPGLGGCNPSSPAGVQHAAQGDAQFRADLDNLAVASWPWEVASSRQPALRIRHQSMVQTTPGRRLRLGKQAVRDSLARPNRLFRN
jgi:hypothetical protein